MLFLDWIKPAALTLAMAAPLLGAEPGPDEAAIEDAAVKFVDAYNTQDVAAIAELFTEDARLEEADGTIIKGRDAVREAFQQAFNDEPSERIGIEMDSLSLLTPDVAVEEGATEFYPDGEMLTSRGRYIVVHLKKDGVWRMASVRSLEKEVVSNYEYLRRLDWLLGDWIDQDAQEVVETNFHWDDERNFLIQEFRVRRGEDVVQTGTQRLGWDPETRQIRGWIFDSQGGFGESRWMEVGDSWLVTSAGVSSDGVRSSGTRTFTPQGDRVAVQLSNRIRGDAAQADIDFTMVRRPPKPAETASK